MPLQLRFEIASVAKGRPRFGKGRTYTPRKTAVFERDLKILARAQYRGPLLEGALFVAIHIFIEKPKRTKRKYPSVRPDLDNYQKAVFDALNGIVWKDDGQIVRCEAAKHYYEFDDPQISVVITQLT